MTDFSQYTPDSKGYAAYLADQHAARLRYATDTGHFYKYTGTHWQECSPGNVEIRSTVNVNADYIRQRMPSKPDKDSPGFYAWTVQAAFVRLAGSADSTSSVVSKLKDDPRLWCTLNDFTGSPYLLNFRNGTVNLREPFRDRDSDEIYFHAHDPGDMIATVLRYDYPAFQFPAAPLWDSLLMHMCGQDESLKDSLESALAYGLLGANPEQLAVFLVGEPNIGKTQVLEVVAELAGSLGGYGKVELIQYTRNQEHDSIRADLRGKHFVMLGETSHRLRLDEMKFKDLTGASYIPTRKLGQQPVATRVTWTLYCATNELPEVPGEMDDAVARRMWVFQLPGRQIPRNQRDTDLTRRIIAQEGQAVLYRLARRLSEWYSSGARPEMHPLSVRALDEYREESNTVAEYARSCLTRSEGAWVSYDAVHESYLNFCRKRSLAPVSRRQLPRKISEVLMVERDSSHSRLRDVAIAFEAPSWH